MEMHSEVRSSRPWRTTILSTGALLLVIAVVGSPKEAFDASIQGLDIWWKIVFPAMLPFLMLSQMLTALGFTQAMGTLLGPLMQRWFRLPGSAGYALAIGMCGGFPAGADAVAHLVQDKQITARQAVVLAAVAHFANPMMIMIVIGAAFLHQPATGYFLLVIHWISGWIAAAIVAARVLPAPHKKHTQNSPLVTEEAASTRSQSLVQRDGLGTRMMVAAKEAHIRDGRSFGKLLGDTVSQAVQTLMLIGGYIIVFAVFIRLLSLYLTPGAPAALWPSLLELHLGTYHLSQSSLSPALVTALLAAALGWGGICSHLQVSAILKNVIPGVKSMLYFTIIRLLHGLIAFSLTMLLWRLFSRHNSEALTTWQTAEHHASEWSPLSFLLAPDNTSTVHMIWRAFPAACISLALLLGVMITLSGLIFLFNRRFSR